MSDAVRREFLLTGEAPAGALWQFVKSNARAFAERGHPLRVIVTDEEEDRLDQQIRFYFGVVIKAVAEQVWVDGRKFSKESWHEHFARKFLPPTEMVLPDGEVVIKRASIARGHIGVRAMAAFTEEVLAEISTEYGVTV
ncbi:recombinase [Achromobacter mucicolens]|uniref:recombinase n=1 Tax=Achromobacter mucicolens TaxID=1389922 RepID=UPI001CBAF57D|nr:recombinase [Achromobacter mucicolens]UAN04400.1 recombinase [Achromobacter mucicolens]